MIPMINKTQEEYLSLLNSYSAMFWDIDLRPYQVSMFLDEVKVFWLKRLNIVEFEFEELTSNAECFVLSGAIYLNVTEKENFYFKALGDTHVLIDPFLKMEVYFRINETRIDMEETLNYFRRVYEDTLHILEKYPKQFYILPVQEMAWRDKDVLFGLLKMFFWRFISSILKKELKDEEEFSVFYKSFDEIEKDLDPFILKNLIFSDSSDSQLSLKDRIKNYTETQFNSSLLTEARTEAQIFLTLVFSQISQIIDILLTSAAMNVIPFIRFNVTFRYLLLIMQTFIENVETKEMIEKTIIFYVLHERINADLFDGIDFLQYSDRCKEVRLLARIILRLREENIDIISNGIRELPKIIEEEFALLLK
jgi:hypothetical protein